MDAINKLFLSALNAALRGNHLEPTLTPPQWKQLMHLAQIHKVLPLVYEAVGRAPSLQSADAAFLLSIRHQAIQQIMAQAMRTKEFLELNRRLCDAGVTPLVVKGIHCRQLYPQPDQRPSGDEDVLIPPSQLETAQQVLQDFGMHTVEDPEKCANAYEIPFRKEGSPLYIELHKHLFPPESEAYGDWNRFFSTVFDRAMQVTIHEETVGAMAPTDHLFYLICHAFKHFLHSGFGIRQVCDIVLYAEHYGPEICWDTVLVNCRAIRADRFAAALLRIGRIYLSFDMERACYPASWQAIQVDEQPMLTDLLEGGLYGDSSLSRKHSSNLTLDAVSSQKRGKHSGSGFLRSAFPSAQKLQSRYPYLQKQPYLLPVAWCSRLWNYAQETQHTRNNRAADALKIGRDRILLMKEYGILD